MTLWVYGWTTASARALGRGASGEPLRALRLRPGAVAIAGEMARPLKPSLVALRAQDKVVRRLFARLGALVPARFGSAAGDLSELRGAMEGRWAALSRVLVELRGMVQMTARGFGRAQRPARGSLPRTPGARYLAKAARRISVPELAKARADYGRFIRREILERNDTPPLAWTAHHLVDRRVLRAYRSAIRRAAGSAGFEVAVTGPHPPYAFAAEL
jgi:hypothetical protein